MWKNYYNKKTTLNKDGSIRKKPIQYEAIIQKSCINWFNAMGFEEKGLAMINHQPNENSRGSTMQYNKEMNRRGRITGFPDLQIFLPTGKSFFIEMKHKTELSKNQYSVKERLNRFDFEVYTCHSLDEFKAILSIYFHIENS